MHLDYSSQNLRGRSFKGQNLTGANFNRADIRGADFSNAILKDADFKGAKSGLQRRWVIGLLIFSWLLSALSSIVSNYLFPIVVFTYQTTLIKDPITTGIFFVISLIVFFVTTLYKSLTTGVIVTSIILLCAYFGIFFQMFILGASNSIFSTAIIAIIFIFAFSFPIIITGAIAVIIAIVVAGARGVVTPFIGTITGAIVYAGFLVINQPITQLVRLSIASVGVISTPVALAFILPGAYIGWRSLSKDEKDAWIRKIAITFAATGGTSFYNADLTDADFTGATLKNTDLRNANITRTRFYEAKKLEFARVGNSILSHRNILNLLVTGNGRGKSYAAANLQGANLIGADLKKANLKDADISEATFQEACLEWANLTLTQAVGTDFTSAQMTGAWVEAWNIESTTKLDNVDCRFIYLLENPKPGTDDRERRPSSGEFQPGEFTKLFEEVLNTVDLIFRNGIDWKAFVAAFKKVQVENEDTELAIQSIENKGDGVVVVKVAVPIDANKEKIHSDFTQNYQLALQAVEEKYKAQLQAKEEQIVIYRQQSAQMKEIVTLLANKPINVQVDNKLENKNMTNSNDSSRKIEIGSVGRDFNASGQALNLGDISGTVTNTINELPASPEPEKPGIKELLTQLQTAIEAEENLTPKNKEKALKQVKALAEASQNPNDEEKQDLADTAITMLKGLISSLPTATTLVEACSNLIPMISKFLGIG